MTRKLDTTIYLPFARQDIPSERKEGNTGLWYNKFFDQWAKSKKGNICIAGAEGDDKDYSGKQEWIKTVADGKLVGEPEQIRLYGERMHDLLQAHGQEPLLYRLESDFVTGLGLEHPVENGFAWHHTLGTPYLPGSSVKGLVRAWAEQWQSDVSPECFLRIFGRERRSKEDEQGEKGERGASSRVGSVIFLDAIPTGDAKLKTDIMTPHYGAYYQDSSGATPPADYLTPNPIPFLVVEKGPTFLFGILPRALQESQTDQDCARVKEWLKQGLEWLGAGAKTAVGYGRFFHDTEQEAARVKDAKLAEMPPIMREIYVDGYEKADFVRQGTMRKWLKTISERPREEQVKIVELCLKWYEDHPEERRGKAYKRDKKIIADILD